VLLLCYSDGQDVGKVMLYLRLAKDLHLLIKWWQVRVATGGIRAMVGLKLVGSEGL